MVLKSMFSFKLLLKYICIKLGYKFIIIYSNISFLKNLLKNKSRKYFGTYLKQKLNCKKKNEYLLSIRKPY
jgi:hypothetical protein